LHLLSVLALAADKKIKMNGFVNRFFGL